MVATLIRTVIAAEWLAGITLAVWLARQPGWPAWLAALAGLAVPVLLHGTAIGLEMLVGAWHRRRFATANGAPREATGASVALRAWIGESLASLRSFMLLMPWRGNAPLPGGDDPRRLPVVLVHGYFCNRAIWLPMARRLAARGHAIDAPNLEPPTADIEHHVAALDAAVERLRARTGAQRVALVGHSMGGLVIRAWLRRNGAARVAKVVTLGSPHRGTWSAWHAPGHNAAQMRQGSEWLAALSGAERTAERRLFTVILSLHDNIVMPQAAQTLDDAQTVVLAGLGHVALAQSRAVFGHVVAALEAAGEAEAAGGDAPAAVLPRRDAAPASG